MHHTDVDSRIIVRSRYNLFGGQISDSGGWYRIAGTSEAAPLTAEAADVLDATSGCNAAQQPRLLRPYGLGRGVRHGTDGDTPRFAPTSESPGWDRTKPDERRA